MVYPRVCGATMSPVGTSSKGAGLSPRVRGYLEVYRLRRAATGSIPACAGLPPTSTRWRPSTSGLSPRVRGYLSIRGRSIFCVRSIPACAGLPRSGCGRHLAPRVYPRVCGATTKRDVKSIAVTGLSPRVRGYPSELLSVGVTNGSIPACAGLPCNSLCFAPKKRVYPRVCGATARSRGSPRPLQGLSPRVRGYPRTPSRLRRSRRSIPACAGLPPAPGSRVALSWVYPRVCGATCTSLYPVPRIPGLSPRVRGYRRRCDRLLRTSGSIPACAGLPRGRPLPRSRGRVYPRVCGATRRM